MLVSSKYTACSERIFHPYRISWWLVGSLIVAAGLKIILLIAGAVPFNSDEAIVALMAKHILEGERPVFFYGQAYMGSLDAGLVAIAFRVIGMQVYAIRVVQILIYLAYLLSLYVLVRSIFDEERTAILAMWIAAIPTVLMTTYTTASLGGYGEVLFLGNLILWLGYQVVYGKWGSSYAAWTSFGLVSGLAFWTLGVAGIYILPVAIAGILRSKKSQLPFYILALLAFLMGSSPWWIYNFGHANESFAILTGTSNMSISGATVKERLSGIILLGLPTLLGLRFPWSPRFSPLPVLFAGLIFYISTAWYLTRSIRNHQLPVRPGGLVILGLMIIIYCLAMIGTHFGYDSTGRYFTPLNLLLVLGVAAFIQAAWSHRRYYGVALLLLSFAINGSETIRAATSVDKITTQFDPITRFDNNHDAELMAFLREHDELRGYANYWVSFRIAFLSNEQIIYTPRLPNKADLSYTLVDNRYPIYDQWVASSTKVAYITSKHPQLDALIRQGFNSLKVHYLETQIGDYHIFYDLARAVRPQEIGLGSTRLKPGVMSTR
jgi:4-amino-4-deoxy-L-arabinose transferase-like glycosyltransferase